MSSILQFDESLFHFINGEMHNYVLDIIMPYWREKLLWAPLYLFLVFFMVMNFKIKGLYFLLFVIAIITISDTLSSQVIKKTYERDRPCNNIYLKKKVNLLVDCGPGYSFTSSHATNHFAIAVFFILTLGRMIKWIKWPFILWAASISFAQVYVGVHFPLDVIVGALLGSFIGFWVSVIYQSYNELKFTDDRYA